MLSRGGQWARFLSVALATTNGLAACKGSSSDQVAKKAGRGTAACHEWQRAICDFSARCGSAAQANCEDQAASITCKSDDLATSCAAEFDKASCNPVPVSVVSCDFSQVADPAPAVKACNDYVLAVCNVGARCNGPPIDTCVADTATQLDCSKAIGVDLSFEQCLTDLKALTCGANLPASCNGAIKATR